MPAAWLGLIIQLPECRPTNGRITGPSLDRCLHSSGLRKNSRLIGSVARAFLPVLKPLNLASAHSQNSGGAGLFPQTVRVAWK